MRMLGRARLLGAAVAAACATTPSLADQALGPQYFDYQVRLPQAPQDAATAQRTIDARRQAVLATVACGDELAYAADGISREAGEDSAARVLAKLEWGAGHLDIEGHRRIEGYCRFSRTLRWGDFDNAEMCTLLSGAAACTDQPKIEAAAENVWRNLLTGQLAELKSTILQSMLPDTVRSCIQGFPTGERGPKSDRSVLAWRLLDPFPGATGAAGARTGAVQIDFAISQECLLRQAAQSLQTFVIPVKDGKQQRAGTDGQPCHLFGTVYGDWDMAERNLIRIAYLIRRDGLDGDGAPLHDAYLQLRNNLLTLDRGLEGDSHSIVFGCGNDTGHTGAPEDRANDRADSGKSRNDALGDLGWFLLMLLLLLVAAALVAAALVALGIAGAIAAAAAVAIVVATFLVANIPETENHLLGINTTKYLNNQLIIETLGNDITLTGPYIRDQIEIKAWLLKRMQGYLQHDFIEYNARPYQRHAVESIRNIADFAGDPGRPTVSDDDLRNAANLVLDYTAAKFAVGSSQGRRMVPYRRHRSDFAKAVDVDASGWNGIFDQASSADHQVGIALLYAGQTQQLPLGQASRSFAAEIVSAATSFYEPEATILDLAIAKDVPIYQRMSHTVPEIYASGPGYLISAGSLSSGLAYPVTGIAFIDGHIDDWGSGVPTTLFLIGDPTPGLSYLATPPAPGSSDPKSIDQQIFQLQLSLAGPGVAPPIRPGIPFDSSVNGIYAAYLAEMRPDARTRSTLGEFIRIKGEYHLDTTKESDGSITRMPTYDNNLCVWDGFACGTNIDLGAMAQDCQLVAGPVPWTFIDSAQCKGRATAPRTLIAIFSKDCPASRKCTNYGLLEIIGAADYAAIRGLAPGVDPFPVFTAQVAGDNAALASMPAGPNMVSTYKSARGQAIEFSSWGHESGDDYWGVFYVDGIATHKLPDWPFAGGEWNGSGSPLQPNVRTPMIATGDGLLDISSPHLKSPADPSKPRVLRLDFRNRDHPAGPIEQ